MSTTRIRRLYIQGFQQFRNTMLDFTNPKTGRAVERVCLIGRNGTGKSTVLRLLDHVLMSLNGKFRWPERVLIELEHNDRRLLVRLAFNERLVYLDLSGSVIDSESIRACVDDDALNMMLRADPTITRLSQEQWSLLRVGILEPADLLVYCPAEVPSNQGVVLDGVPASTLNKALERFRQFIPLRHEVSNEQLAEMWNILVYLVKKREHDRQEFELRPESLQKTKAQLIAEFDHTNPPVLDGLATLWNRILAPAGLELDVENAVIPFQLNENLLAYIRLRDSKQRVPYSNLSTGIRNFLFRIGHLYLLYFNRPIERGFVLVDEPENSLFPDFLFDLMKIYEEILRDPATGQTHTQMFVATHSPIVAAQFEPYERILLDWDDDGGVIATKGTAPKGDDPNDLLLKDFHLPQVMGEEGQRSWQRYVELRKQIRRAPEQERHALVKEAARIARDYGFPVPTP